MGKRSLFIYAHLEPSDFANGSECEERRKNGRTYNQRKSKYSHLLTMEGVYTTSVSEATLDEAPMAYKSLEDIIDVIKESVDVIDIMKPIYNFKAN